MSLHARSKKEGAGKSPLRHVVVGRRANGGGADAMEAGPDKGEAGVTGTFRTVVSSSPIASRIALSLSVPRHGALLRRCVVLLGVCIVMFMCRGIRTWWPVMKALQELNLHSTIVNLREIEETYINAGPRDKASATIERKKLRAWLEEMQELHGKYDPSKFSGEGIVFCAGGATMLRQVMAQIIYLRESLHSTLPIEIMYMGGHEMTDSWKHSLEAFPDVKVMDLIEMPDPLTGQNVQRPPKLVTHLKPAAVLLSSFEKVIFIDTNNYATKDPRALFSRDQFLQDGYLMWSDLWLSTSIAHEYAIYSLIGAAPPAGFENTESGVMYWDKRRRWRELLMTWALGGQLDKRKIINGDKQMYGHAFSAMGQTLHHTFPRASVVGVQKQSGWFAPSHSVKFVPLGIHQQDPLHSGVGFFHSMGATKSLKPFSAHGVTHVLNMTAAAIEPQFDILELSMYKAPYALSKAVTMTDHDAKRFLINIPQDVQTLAMQARTAFDDPRVLKAFGPHHVSLVVKLVAWFLGRL